MTHFELISVEGVRLRVRFVLAWGCLVAPGPLRRPTLLHGTAFALLPKVSWAYLCRSNSPILISKKETCQINFNNYPVYAKYYHAINIKS